MEMLTVQDVAGELNVSSSLVYGLIASGEIACHRIGKRRGTIRVRRDDLDRYLEGCRVASGDPPAHVPRQQLKHLRL
jgi:excisionase family DNA binding protein